jgi:hypothetical protein
MERRQAKRDGAKPVKNSGRGHEKGDAKLPGFLMDYKFNDKSFQLTADNWVKFSNQAWKQDRREPIICVNFGDGSRIAIIDWSVFRQYFEEINMKMGDDLTGIDWEGIEDVGNPR